MSTRQPVLFLSHGSPLTALGGDELAGCWARLAGRLSRPAAILMVSAHWTTRIPMLSGGAQPKTIHDFGGFPAELYALRYPVPGDPGLALRVKQVLAGTGIAAGVDASRGLDHGAWVPLRSLFPDADVPVVQLSVQPERCARHHFALGRALAAFSDENVLVIGSGHMTHNLMDYMRPTGGLPAVESRAFREWVHALVLGGGETAIEALFDWERQAPGARAAHPTPEHFLPLFVALGAAGAEYKTEWLGGGWVADVLAADGYLFERVQ